MVPLGCEVLLRVIKDKVEVSNERENEEKINGNSAKGCQDVEEEEINGCKKCKERSN